MNRRELTEIIQREKIVAVIRLAHQEVISSVIANLIAGGIRVLEITSNTPGYLSAIQKCRVTHPDIVAGAGTVMNVQIASEAIEAGAQFLVTPNCRTEIIELAHKHDVPVMMGAFTPTEIADALEAGADFIKLFPAGILGIPYLKSVLAPFKEAKIFANGGIGEDNIMDWLNAGAVGVGVGGTLMKSTITLDETAAIQEKTRALVRKITPDQ